MENNKILCPECGDEIPINDINGSWVCKNCGAYLELIDGELICVEDD